MGYRLHYATEYKVKWDGGYFGGSDVDDVKRLLEEHDCMVYGAEDADIWEIDKEALKNMIKELRKTPDQKSELVLEETNGELADIFEKILNNSEPNEDYIRIEWF